MKDITLFTMVSTVVGVLGIVLGTALPAVSMGKIMCQALESLARQPQAESSITRTLFVGLAMVESLAIYCLVVVLIVMFRNPLLQHLLDALKP